GLCSTVTACKENSNSICAVRTAHGTLIAQNTELACPIAVLAAFFGTLAPDFSGPKWPFLSVLFAKRSKMTPSFKIQSTSNLLSCRLISEPLTFPFRIKRNARLLDVGNVFLISLHPPVQRNKLESDCNAKLEWFGTT